MKKMTPHQMKDFAKQVCQLQLREFEREREREREREKRERVFKKDEFIPT